MHHLTRIFVLESRKACSYKLIKVCLTVNHALKGLVVVTIDGLPSIPKIFINY
jgi:hypothetical protein